MIRRCKITEIFSFFGEIFSNTSRTPEILLSSILLNRIGRKSETDKFFEALSRFGRYSIKVGGQGIYDTYILVNCELPEFCCVASSYFKNTKFS